MTHHLFAHHYALNYTHDDGDIKKLAAEELDKKQVVTDVRKTILYRNLCAVCKVDLCDDCTVLQILQRINMIQSYHDSKGH